MLGEISVVPQIEGPAREIVAEVVDEIDTHGLRYDVTPTGTCVEGELADILVTLAAIEARLRSRGAERALIELRLQPHLHALARSVARILERDHLHIADQLAQAGVRIDGTPIAS